MSIDREGASMDIKQQRLYLIASGMINAVGANAAMVNAAINAGISGYQLTACFNKRRKPIRMANIPSDVLEPLDEGLAEVAQVHPGHAHMVRIASQALRECLANYTGTRPIPLFMSCPETIPRANPRIHQDFIQHLQIQSKANIDIKNSRKFATGRAGGFQALESAFQYLASAENEFSLVGGVDSYQYCLQQLSVLDDEDRLLVEEAAEGFVPGEAGAFVLLASAKTLEKYQLSSALTIAYPCEASEKGHRYSQQPYSGDGLANAFHGALANAPELAVGTIYTSLNGENFGSKEMGVALMRNSGRISADVVIKHPADCFGDIGAAFGPVLLGLMGKAKTCSAIAYCSSDTEYRSAVCAWK
ncbi:MAG TPA: hypothetical protein VN030_00220 [Cellvibrio sp.]|nr:hypothetical protein [Cellvibrio sp.]